MTVKMPRVGSRTCIAHHHSDCLIAAHIVNIPVWVHGVRGISLIGEKKDWVVVVASEGRVIDRPDKMPGSVDGDIDLHLNGHVGFASRDGV